LFQGVYQLLIDVADIADQFTLNDWLVAARKLTDEILANGQLPILCGGTGLYISAFSEGYIPGSGRGAKVKSPPAMTVKLLMPKIDRSGLYQKSDNRILENFDRVVEEVRELIDHGVPPEKFYRLGLDYRYAMMTATGVTEKALAVKYLQQASRQYIRRQLTWWRHHGSPEEFTTPSMAVALSTKFLKEN
jgi:tRNA A37 N6-isopentenylltransferase MiaA